MSIILCTKIYSFSAKYYRKTSSCPITSACPITKPKVYMIYGFLFLDFSKYVIKSTMKGATKVINFNAGRRVNKYRIVRGTFKMT